MNQKADEPAIRVHGTDARGKMYGTISDLHKLITEAKWKSGLVGQKVQIPISPADFLVHLEASLHFLAEELLAMQAKIEDAGNPCEIVALKQVLGEEDADVDP